MKFFNFVLEQKLDRHFCVKFHGDFDGNGFEAQKLVIDLLIVSKCIQSNQSLKGTPVTARGLEFASQLWLLSLIYIYIYQWRNVTLCRPQWRNGAPGAPATPEGDVLGGRQIVIKMWDNFATLTLRLAKVRVWFSNLTIYLDFSAIF